MGNTFYIIWTTMTACLTMSTAAVLALSILTDHWESIQYSKEKLVKVALSNNLTISDYFGDNRLTVVTGLDTQNGTTNSTTELLLQMHGGLWSVCYDLTEIEHFNISEAFPDIFVHPLCLNHREETQKFAEKTETTKDSRQLRKYPSEVASDQNNGNLRDQKYAEKTETTKGGRQLRLLNLCISSSLVCLILLSACLVVFWAGLAKKQVPPVLVVSVLFVLSALFAMFSLFFMQVKRDPHHNSSFLDGYTSTIWQDSREFHVSWSYYLGWLGVGGCFVSSISVYVLTRIMRSTLPYLV